MTKEYLPVFSLTRALSSSMGWPRDRRASSAISGVTSLASNSTETGMILPDCSDRTNFFF